MKLSFTTVCMDRLFHLKETLPSNIEDTADIDREFIILNYNSKDRMNEYLWNHFQSEIKSGLVKVFYTKTPKYFKMSHSKNVAAQQAQGDILVNLDADNFVVKGFGEWVLEQFTDDPNIVCRHDSQRVASVGGKIAISKRNMLRIKGYNESLKGWGFEDVDFMQRATAFFNLECRYIPLSLVDAIQHTNKERFENYEPDIFDKGIETVKGCEVIRYHGITEKEFKEKYDGSKYFEQPEFDYWAKEWEDDPEAVEYFGYAEWREHIPFWDLHYIDDESFNKYHKYPNHKIDPKKSVNPRGWGRGRVKRLFV